jgi:phosphohistidine phosphatase SixA
MSQLAHDLQTEPAEGGAGQLPTAGIAVLAIDGSWADVRPRTAALLHWHVPRA